MKALTLLLAAVLWCGMAHAQVPHMLNYQGFLTDATGQPINTTQPMVFKIYTAASGGAPLYSENQTVAVNSGVFSVVLGAVAPLNLAFDVPYYLGVSVGVDPEMTPRQLVTASPYALRSANADALAPAASVDGQQISGLIASATLPTGNLSGNIATAQIANNAVTQIKLSPLSGAAAGKVLGTDGSNLQWQTPSAGTVTSVGTGTGLSGGPITGSGTINLAPNQLLPAVSCAPTQIPKWNGSAWACAPDNDSSGTVTSVGTGTGLTGGPITGSGTINLAPNQLLPAISCAPTQIPKWNGSAWACAADNDTNNAANDARYFKQGGNAFGANGVLGTTDNFALDLRANGQRVMRYEPGAISPNVIGGSPANNVTAGVRGATIGGGGVAPGTDPLFAGNAPNRVTAAYGTVGGGYGNRAGDDTASISNSAFATVAGGFLNTASNYTSTVGGGIGNTASGWYSTVAGGLQNAATATNSAVAGGTNNVASNAGSFVGGGVDNVASGENSFAAGSGARTQTSGGSPVVHDGAFIWADKQVSGSSFHTTAPGEFAARATGGVRFVTAVNVLGTPTRTLSINPNGELDFGSVTRQMLNFYGTTWGIGVQSSTQYFRSGNHFAWFLNGTHSDTSLDPGSGGGALMTLTNGTPGGLPAVTGLARAQTFTSTSDRNAKEAFAAVDGEQVLAALVRMPLQSWKYRNEDAAVRHIGPTAQDFRAAFGIGYDDKTIATVDADGVAFAAIQGLHAKLHERDAQLARQQMEIDALKRSMAELQHALRAMAINVAVRQAPGKSAATP